MSISQMSLDQKKRNLAQIKDRKRSHLFLQQLVLGVEVVLLVLEQVDLHLEVVALLHQLILLRLRVLQILHDPTDFRGRQERKAWITDRL